jgi:hypothetical protein
MNAQFQKFKFTQNPIMGIKYYLIVTALCCWAIQLNAQQTNKPDANIRMANIHLIAQAAADSVVLRWAPSTAGVGALPIIWAILLNVLKLLQAMSCPIRLSNA